ncbi:MAG: hypothetical protein ACYTFG_18240, partial [Planctomycetota bacterium]
MDTGEYKDDELPPKYDDRAAWAIDMYEIMERIENRKKEIGGIPETEKSDMRARFFEQFERGIHIFTDIV